MTSPRLTAVTRTQGATAALKSGAVRPVGFEFDFEEVPVLVQAFRRMVRAQEFDVCEMALTTYLVAREHGVPITAVPAFLVRGFHHGAILVREGSGVTEPRHLEGRRVGVNRGYTVTTGVWARAVLAEEHGVDLDQVTWVLSGDEHVQQYSPPSNVQSLEPGRSLADMLSTGELAAVVGAEIDEPGVTPLLADPDRAAMDAVVQRGLFPINHLVVVRDELLAQRPELGAQVFDAFARAKNAYVDVLRAGGPSEPTANDRLMLRVLEATGADPLPYGLEPNRAVLAHLMAQAVDQHILAAPVPLEQLFAPTTLGLTA